MSIALDMYQTVAIAVLVLMLGAFLRKKIHFLEKFCIPAPVIGGLLFAILTCVLHGTGLADVSFDDTLKEVCMVLFFTSVGFQANLKVLKSGGKSMIVFLILVILLIVGQNFTALGLSNLLGLDPLIGMCTGSIPMDREIMAFCQSFMTELCKYIGADVDVPAGDIGTGAREIGFMFGQFKRIRGSYEGVLTGKGLTYGGSLARTEATGYGLLYLTNALLKDHDIDIAGKTCAVSGAGNVAIYAIQKAHQLGAKCVTCSDSTGWIYDPEGIDVALLKEVKEVKRARLDAYAAARPSAEYHVKKDANDHGVWSIKCDLALPCATQNELNLDDAKMLVANGVISVTEGANMPTTLEATKYLQENGVLFVGGKAANAGGVATSALEMSQNSERLSWTFEEVDGKLKGIMETIYANISDAAKRYDMTVGGNADYVAGANIAGFEKVVDAMLAQGVC